uniref:Uncharacterized protein n=1 Tax=Acrobeloides nanus TaxID=290746 RepID=A0A914C6K1_9BILA
MKHFILLIFIICLNKISGDVQIHHIPCDQFNQDEVDHFCDLYYDGDFYVDGTSLCFNGTNGTVGANQVDMNEGCYEYTLYYSGIFINNSSVRAYENNNESLEIQGEFSQINKRIPLKKDSIYGNILTIYPTKYTNDAKIVLEMINQKNSGFLCIKRLGIFNQCHVDADD